MHLTNFAFSPPTVVTMANRPRRSAAPHPPLLLILWFGLISITIDAQPSPVSLLVRNEAKSPFQLLWIDPDASIAEQVISYDGGVLPGNDFSFEYVNPHCS
jgi:hypothetical protein